MQSLKYLLFLDGKADLWDTGVWENVLLGKILGEISSGKLPRPSKYIITHKIIMKLLLRF